ncbi:MAG: hypothetical protein GY749_12570, partial [Desulfobacteraceae bacterium]|nr:hypothetical protein [Desulfobacteraceae bacterium]
MKRFFLSTVGIVLFLLCISVIAGADTEFGGSIAGDTIWNLAGSPYIVTSDVTVEAGVTLTVQAGVKVKFNTGLALNVSGTLNASGTTPITFTSDQTSPASDTWEGIRFYDNSAGTFDNCVIEYARVGIYMNGDGAPQIANSTLRYNNRGIEVYNRHGIPQPV